MTTNRLLRRKEASEYLHEKHGLQRAPSTLAKLAVIGGGPIFQYDGRLPLYTPENLDAYAGSALSAPMRSTSEADFAASYLAIFSGAAESRAREGKRLPSG